MPVEHRSSGVPKEEVAVDVDGNHADLFAGPPWRCKRAHVAVANEQRDIDLGTSDRDPVVEHEQRDRAVDLGWFFRNRPQYQAVGGRSASQVLASMSVEISAIVDRRDFRRASNEASSGAVRTSLCAQPTVNAGALDPHALGEVAARCDTQQRSDGSARLGAQVLCRESSRASSRHHFSGRPRGDRSPALREADIPGRLRRFDGDHSDVV